VTLNLKFGLMLLWLEH